VSLSLFTWQDERRVAESKTFATCWRISRSDGVILRFTDHSTPLDVLTDQDLLQSVTDGNETFYPAGGFDASARQLRPALEAQNLEVKGFLSSSKITYDDLFAGRYDDAEVTEFTVDHRYPWLGPFRVTRYWVLEVGYDEESWTAKVVGISRWLKQGAGRTYGPECDADLGDARCGYNIVTNKLVQTDSVPKYVTDARQAVSVKCQVTVPNLQTVSHSPRS